MYFSCTNQKTSCQSIEKERPEKKIKQSAPQKTPQKLPKQTNKTKTVIAFCFKGHEGG